MDDDEFVAQVRAKLEQRIAGKQEPKIQYNIVLPVTEEQVERILKILGEEG